MKKQTKVITIIVGVIILVVAGIGGKMYMDHQKNEEKLIGYQKIAAKQIKNTFADVEKIEFDKDSIDRNKLSGDIGIDVYITTKKEKAHIILTLPVDKNDYKLTSYIGDSPKEGKTQETMKVYFTHKTSEEM